MDITILGARGSVPVNGKDMLEFGGSTSCVMIEGGENVLFLDAGTGIMSTPDIGDRSIHIVLTHPHADHLIGLPFFPYIYEKDRQIDIYAVPREGLDTFAQVTKLISRPLWAVRVDEYASDVRCHDVTGPFKIGNVSIAMTESDHPGGSSIIRLTCGRSSLVYATDYEHSEEGDARLIDFSRDADLLLYDGQYTEEEYKTKIKKYLPTLITLGAAAVITILTGVLGILDRPDSYIADALYQHPKALDGKIIVIGIDEKAIEKIGPYNTWDRNIMASALNVLGEDPDMMPAVVGNMGSEKHMDYTAIGDTVNTAARLEANAPGGMVYISRAVADMLPGRIKYTSLGNTVRLKGKSEDFEVLRLED